MAKLPLCSVTPDELCRLVELEPSGAAGEAWTRPSEPVDERTQILLDYLTAKLAEADPTTLNEATLWSRALYPLLELAETGRVRAWAEVALTAKDPFSDAELTGVVDGVLAPESVFAGTPGQPFLLVMVAKRGVGATDPRLALLAALVAVLWTQLGPAEAGARIEAFGCFTAGDIWTFVRADATVRPEDRTPRLGVTLTWSREYAERSEAAAILQILRGITRLLPDSTNRGNLNSPFVCGDFFLDFGEPSAAAGGR